MAESIIPESALEALPILALRNSVLFPASVVPVNVGRPRSVRLIEEAFGQERPTIGVLAQRDADEEDPDFDRLHEVGTLARVLKVIRLSSGHYSVVLQGITRMRVVEMVGREPCLRARCERMHETVLRDEEIDALTAHLRELARGQVPLPISSRRTCRSRPIASRRSCRRSTCASASRPCLR
jgi:ATP-dependent Lon protease